MGEPLVSIIIPTYNVERYIEECIDSLLKQTYKRIEIIVIDDGSKDATPYLLKSYEERILLKLNKKNQGQGAVRNHGLEQANGEYILFVDSDDWIDVEAVEILVGKALDTEADLIRFNGKTVFEGDSDLSKENLYTFNSILNEKVLYTNVGLLDANRKAYSASPCLYLIKKEVIEEELLSFPEGVLHEDEYFTTKLFISIKSMAYVNKALYYRRYRLASTMTENTKEHKVRSSKSYLKVFKLLEELYLSNQYNDSQKSFLKRQLISIYHGLQQSDVNSDLKKELRSLKTITLKDRLQIEVSKLRQKIEKR